MGNHQQTFAAVQNGGGYQHKQGTPLGLFPLTPLCH